MTLMQQTRSSKAYLILFLLVSLQIAVSNSSPLSTTNQLQGTLRPPCEMSSQSPECGTSVSPSPAPRSCKAHQSEWDQLISAPDRYLAVCDYSLADEKHSAGTLEQTDLVNCYRPHCDPTNKEHYIIKQCSFHFQDWCWCSTPQGQALPETFQKDMPEGFCNQQLLQCHVNGKDYNIGTIFTPSGVCGFCECHSDGTHTCFINYTVDANNQLSNQQLEILKNHLLQVFKLQHNQQPVEPADVLQIHKMDAQFEDDEKSVILSSKFNSYDRDEDGILNRFEKFSFLEDLRTLFGCNEFFDHLNSLMDSNKDGKISLPEWNAFFGLLLTAVSEVDVSGDSPTQGVVQKREVPLDIRKPLHLRKKFHYIIS